MPFLIKYLYQDEDLLICDKPADLLSVPGRGPENQDCLITRVQNDYPTALTVHRLDMATSGLMVIALNKDTQRALGRLFENREIEKEYTAEVFGIVLEDEGKVELPLISDWPNRPKQKVCFESGKKALTHFEVIERREKSTLMRLKPVTGRSHQLRVHMLALGHPILGDYFYAEGEALEAAPRLHLHARYLSFIHPSTGKRIALASPTDF
jgi:tRNA pseudouridine32 synthase/23S rRNA pseudouridine746 synthase